MIVGNEWRYIKECLDTGWVSSAGRFVNEFENNIRDYTGAKYAIACVNGTAALHISLILCGVKEDDEVIVPTLTFIAPVNAVKYCRAEPVFMDADKYFNIDIEKTIDFLKKETVFKNGYTYNKKTGKIIRAIIPVHIFGNAIFMDELVRICIEKNIRIVEDATESMGTYYKTGKYIGKFTGTIGDIGCISFNGNKIITTGGGGMILTNDKKLAEKAIYLTTQAKDDVIRFTHNEIGYNYRLTNIQAAMGVAQMENLEKYIKIKNRNYDLYNKHLPDGLKLNEAPDYARNNLWLYSIAFGKKIDMNKLIAKFEKENVQVRPVWKLNHTQRMYKKCETYKIENAKRLWERTICLPSSVSLKERDIVKVCEVIRE